MVILFLVGYPRRMPNSAPLLVRAALLLPFIHHFEQRGGDVDLLLEDLQVSNAIRTDFERHIPVKAVYEVIDEITKRLGDRFVGAAVGRDMARNTQGPLSKALFEAQTVGSLLDRFLVTVGSYGNSTNYLLENDGQNATLKVSRKVRPDANPAQQDALTLALLVEQIRPHVGNDWRAKDVLAVVADETVVPEWVLPRSSLIKGSAMGMTLRIPAQWMLLGSTVHSSDKRPNEGHKEYDTLPETVKTFCKEHLSDPKLDIEITARACRLHPKTLSRMLSSHGTSFKAILEEQRKKHAISAIAQGNLSITEVALSTGFTQASNFSRAYKRWTGETPSVARRKQG